MGYIDHVVKRGIEHPATTSFIKRAIEEGPKIELPKWGVAILATTFIAFIVFMSAIEYTLKDVIATLIMVETPSAAITVSPSAEPISLDSKEPLLETGPEITLVHQKPITSSIRSTIRHLVSQAGRFSRWRGIRSQWIYSIAFTVAANVFENITPRFPGSKIVISAISGALCANLHASWTHKVISMPSKLNFFKRIPARSQWKVLAGPAALQASARYLCMYMVHASVILLRLDRVSNDNFAEYTGKDWSSLALRVLGVFCVILFGAFFVVLPSNVSLIRVEASILPDDQDTIVPFDRSFDGKVVPRILGGTGSIGFLDAWKSFTWERRRALIKHYMKIFAIETVLFITLAHVLALETWAIMGPALSKYIAEAKQQAMMS